MSTAITSPGTFEQSSAVTGHDFIFAQRMIDVALRERLRATELGLVTFYGDLVGSGSDTVKVTSVSGIGGGEAFTTMADETEAIEESGWTLDSDVMSIARHGLSKSMSYQEQAINAGRAQAVDLGMLVGMIPESWHRTLLTLLCEEFTGFSSSSGSTGADWDVAKELAMLAAFRGTEGFDGKLVTIRHPEAYEQLRVALRTEGSQLFAPQFAGQQGIGGGIGRPGGELDNFLGVANFQSHRIASSGSDYVGGAFVPGALGWVSCNTAPVRVKNPATAIYLPPYGMLIEQTGDEHESRSGYVAATFFGVGKRKASVFPQRKLISAH